MIADQGHGFDQTQLQVGYGLRGMRERMSVLGGSLQIQTEPNKGTTIWVQIRVDHA
jgi:signal transduction histidine kinase